MSREMIAKRLKSAMGLHTPTVGMVTISSAIGRRMHALNIASEEEYYSLICADENELKELIEAVIIPETWFFRDKQPYAYLLYYVKKNYSHNKGDPVRILSAPCSTGEEPYSIAMMLMDNNYVSNDYQIDAIDIGEKLIEHARQGIYRKHSFRTEDLSFVDRYFTRNNTTFVIDTHVRDAVNFQYANILDESFKPGAGIYDIILCRNLLIYFDAATQQQVFETLDRLLKPDGILILGHAETCYNSNDLFAPAAGSSSYAHIKTASIKKSGQPTTEHVSTQKNRPLLPDRSAPVKARPFTDVTAITRKQPEDAVCDEQDLDLAYKLANKGKLKEALNLCKHHIDSERFSARAHYLIGLIHDTQGSTEEAHKYLRKAIYLDPENIEALIHLSLMAEQHGDINEADRLRNRAQRVQQRCATQ